MKFWKIIIQTGCWVLLMAAVVTAADWPMWRFDAGRTAASPEQLSDSLHLQWSRTFSPRQPVWDDPLNRDLMPYDSQFEPIVIGQSLIIGFNDQDKVMALDVESGEEKWTFYTNGPVRLPAAGWQDRIFVTSDDGFLYCLNANDGSLLWKFNGGPDNSLVLGNKRLISTWPARGGAVVAGDTVYFAASIWPFMGVFVYALDPQDGDVIWRNEGSGATYMLQPHRSPAFAGVAPQGAMAVSGSNLLVPGGRSVPACFDRHTGEMRYYRLSDSGKSGGSFVCARDSILVNHYREGIVNLFNLNDGEVMSWRLGKAPVLMADRYFFAGPTIVERSPENWPDSLQTFATDADFDLIQAGDKLFAAGDHSVSAVKFAQDEPKESLWKQHFVSQPKRLLAAQQHLFVVTEAGEIFSYGPAPKTQPKEWPEPGEAQEASISKKYQKKINGILDDLGKKDGYAYVAGCDDVEFLQSLTLSGDFENIVTFVSDASRRVRMQTQLDRHGVFGNGVSILPYSFSEAQLPPYLADIVVFPTLDKKSLNAELLGKVAACLHPYGGKAWLPIFRNAVPLLQDLIDAHDINLTLTRQNNGLVLTKGSLKGAGNWTHQYGNIANTVTSTDTLVKAPLGLLWFGGNSNLDVLPRHGHGPPEQVVNGRLYLEGMNCLSARDVYTGRVLWKRDFENLGNYMTFYNETYTDTPTLVTYNQEHVPGANSRGTNFIVTPDWVYLVEGRELHVLNAESGDEVNIFELAFTDENTNSDWQYIGIDGERLIAGTGAVFFSKQLPRTADERKAYDSASARKQRGMRDFSNYDNTASSDLVVLDRHTGVEKWRLKSKYGFIHNSIVAGNGKIFCMDKLPPAQRKKMARRGLDVPTDFRLLALDAETGDIIWEEQHNVFGSWLGYSEEFGLLLQATRPSRDMVGGEDGERMIVYNAENGAVRWNKAVSYENPPILHHAQIISYPSAVSLLTGALTMRTDPLTDADIPWKYRREYGCNYVIASENLLSFRSASAGFYDLAGNGGTGNLGGFKSGCTSNLIAANGVLNAPDYTRTCQCSYQNQTSLAMIHMPDLEYWTSNNFDWTGQRIKQLGINLNAPGDRVADNGTLWLDIPSVGGLSPQVPVTIDIENAAFIRRHSAFLEKNSQRWVAASGIAGSGEINIALELNRDTSATETATYTVLLYFAELEDCGIGERVFNVAVQQQPVLTNFDIYKQAGGALKTIIHPVHDVVLKDNLTITLTAVSGKRPLLCGIEIKQQP